MGDIRKISETRSKEEGDWEEWPYPTITIESVITGELRERIGRKYELATEAEVYLYEYEVSGGYSEFTQETDYSIELKVGTGHAAVKLWEHLYCSSSESGMALFLREFG